jgi:hypothetical protein
MHGRPPITAGSKVMRSSFFIGILLPAQRVKFTPACCPKPTTPHIATESVKLIDAVVDFWCENLRRFAENRPLLGVVDRQAGY